MKPKNFLRAASLLFFFSGTSGLVYQVIWVKLLTLQFGSSAWSISTVITAFMAGLGAGGWWAGNKSESFTEPFKVYGILEIAIAVFGLLSLPLLKHIDILIGPLYIFLGRHFLIFVLLRFVLCFIVLIIPTFLMGASLPVLVVGMARTGALQKTIGLLYGINTLGAAFGVVLSGFFLLRWFGISLTITIAVSIGIGVGVISLYINRQWQTSENFAQKQESKQAPVLLLIVVLISGMVSLFYEVSWTRLLMPVVGSSTYAFSIILTTFLCAIGIGGLIASSRRLENFSGYLTIGFLMAFSCFTAISTLFAVDAFPEIMLSLAKICHGRVWLFFIAQSLLAGMLVFLPTCALGIVLPLAMVEYHRRTHVTGKAVGGLYAANTIGSIFGSLGAGFFCLPYIGVRTSIIIAAVVSMAMACSMIYMDKNIPRLKRLIYSLGILSILAVLLNFNPQIDSRQLQAGLFRRILNENKQNEIPGDLLYIRDGISATVTVYRSPDATWLNINGKTEASTLKSDLITQYLLAHIPMFVKYDVENVCVIGLGSGATVRAAASHQVKMVDVIELEPAVEEAYHYFEQINDNVLTQKNVQLHVEDGRTFLRYGKQKYDIIVSEPSNPWIAGVSSVFSKEFYQMVQSRLKPGGVFCQWIQVYEISQETLNVMLCTLSDTFPHIMFFSNGMDLICIASPQSMTFDLGLFEKRIKIPGVSRTLSRIDIYNRYDILAYYAGTFPQDINGFPAKERNTDGNLWLEYRAPIEMYLGLRAKFARVAPTLYLKRVAELLTPVPMEQVAIHLGKSIAQNVPARLEDIQKWSRSSEIPMLLRKDLEQIALEGMRKENKINNIFRQIQIATKHIKNKENKKAIVILERILEVDAEHMQTLRLLGNAWWDLDLKKALHYYHRAAEANPFDYISLSNIGSLHYLLGDLTTGDKYFRRAMDSNPHYLRGRAIWIVLLAKNGKTEMAEKISFEAIPILNNEQFDELQRIINEISEKAK